MGGYRSIHREDIGVSLRDMDRSPRCVSGGVAFVVVGCSEYRAASLATNRTGPKPYDV